MLLLQKPDLMSGLVNFDNIKNPTDFAICFADDERCRAFIEQMRWPNGITCVRCSHTKVYRYNDGRTFRCAACRRKFSAFHGTIFERTKVPLHIWFAAIYQSKTEVLTAHWITYHYRVPHPTAWFMVHRIMEMSQHSFGKKEKFSNVVVEVDETYVGAIKNKQSKHRKKKVNHTDGGGYAHRWAVIGFYVREHGLFGVFSKPYVTSAEMKTLMTTHFEKNCTVYSDTSKVYHWMGKYFKENVQFNHSKGIYGHTKKEHSNAIEGSWGLFKDEIRGYQRRLSTSHGIRYYNEYTFRYNCNNFYKSFIGMEEEPYPFDNFKRSFKDMYHPITLKELRAKGKANKQLVDNYAIARKKKRLADAKKKAIKESSKADSKFP